MIDIKFILAGILTALALGCSKGESAAMGGSPGNEADYAR